MSRNIELMLVSKWYPSAAGRYNALQDIDLHIKQGEFVAMVGKSGSGKSTLLNTLTGINHPSDGSVNINHT